MSTKQLDRAFAPKKLALIGASDRAGSTGRAVLDNIVDGGFAGELIVVHPRHETIAGRPAVKDLRSLAEAPDLVVVVAPREKAADWVEEAAEIGAPAAIVMTEDAPYRNTRILLAVGGT